VTAQMSRRLTIVLISVAALVVVVVLVNVAKGVVMKKFMGMNATQAQTVTTAKVVDSEWQPQTVAIGSARAVRGVDVTTEVAGLVRSIHFRSGDIAKEGQVLVELNADSDRAQLEALNAAADLSQTVLKRDQIQYEDQAISKAQLDADVADLKNRRAQAAAQAALVAKKTLRAPFSGRLGITTVNPGQYLNAGDKLVSLQQSDPIFVDFRLPQRNLGQVKVGQDVEVTTDANAGRVFHGKINAIDSRVDSATRNFQAEATVENHDGALVPGMFARAAVSSGGVEHHLTVPQTAITYNPYGATVFVVKPRTATTPGSAAYEVQQAFVTLGPSRGDQIAVLTGLQDGDEIVTSGQLKLRSGSAIAINNAVQPTNEANPTPQEH
jgi:membrane fusion protein, multidrug efflux system